MELAINSHTQAFVSEKFSVMYYKNSNCIGIREKKGQKRQVFSFGGQKCSLTEDELRGWSVDVLKRLQNHSTKNTAKWIRDTIKELDA